MFRSFICRVTLCQKNIKFRQIWKSLVLWSYLLLKMGKINFFPTGGECIIPSGLLGHLEVKAISFLHLLNYFWKLSYFILFYFFRLKHIIDTWHLHGNRILKSSSDSYPKPGRGWVWKWCCGLTILQHTELWASLLWKLFEGPCGVSAMSGAIQSWKTWMSGNSC